MKQLKIVNNMTPRESLSLNKYMNDISKILRIEVDEEAALARKIRQGDQAALEKITKANLRFVISVAKQYQNQGLGLSDLINEGNIGLIKAAKRFDETRGFKFISYAVRWIRQSILQAIANDSTLVRVPLHQRGSHHKVNQAIDNFMQEFNRAPSDEEVADLLEISVQEVRYLKSIQQKHVSTDAPVGNTEDTSRYDTHQDTSIETSDTQAMKESFQEDIIDAFSVLSDREVTIIQSYFGLHGTNLLSLQELGDLYGLTRERVRQIKDKAINKLRRASRGSTQLKQYLG